MSAVVSSVADARRVGRDFVGILHRLPIEQLLPGKKHNQSLLDKLIHEALAKVESQDTDDEAACAHLQRFLGIVSALYYEGLLLPTAPHAVRDAFIDSLEIAEEATDLERPEVLQ